MEEELRFSNRFEEGYDLYDRKYEAWLKIHHPDAVNKCSTNVFVPITSSTPVLPHASSPVSAAVSQSLSSHHLYTPSTPSISYNSTSVVPSVSTSQENLSTPCPHASAVSGSKTLSGRSPLSDLLNLPKNVLDTKQKTGRARVLTSTECLRLLKEKEEKKKQVELEKERRKQERKLKKQQKEEEQKRKADEKARKATERQALKAKKEAAKAEREAARIEKAKNKVQNIPFKAGTKRCSVGEPRVTRKKARGDMDATVESDLCCVCFGSYQEDIDTGREWLQCSCNRWIHEDCVDNEDLDESSGRLCPLC